MSFFTNFARNAFKLSEKEIDILSFLISKVEDGLPFPEKPSELIRKLNICWAPEMIFTEDYTYGMWTYMHVNSIFLRPEENKPMAIRIKNNVKNPSQKEQKIMDSMNTKPCYSEAVFKYVPHVDHELLSFIIYLLDADGHTTTTTLHEMWHRNQFKSNPFYYLISCLATNLVNYEWACEQSWSIENDVRIKVDNESLRSKLRNICTPFYGYIGKLNKHCNPNTGDTEKEMLEKEMNELRNSHPSVDGLLKMINL